MPELRKWEAVDEEHVAPGVRRKMIWGENVMIVSWRLDPLIELPVHQHVSEQAVMVNTGSLTLIFPQGDDAILKSGDMLIIPPSKPHGVKVGAEGCAVIDVFSPIRTDFLEKTDAYLRPSDQATAEKVADGPPALNEEVAFMSLLNALKGKGAKVTREDIKGIPLQLLARFAYERQCVSMGDLRKILALDREQAKALIREWKHGDDLSAISLQRKMERLVMFSGDDPRGLRSC